MFCLIKRTFSRVIFITVKNYCSVLLTSNRHSYNLYVSDVTELFCNWKSNATIIGVKQHSCRCIVHDTCNLFQKIQVQDNLSNIIVLCLDFLKYIISIIKSILRIKYLFGIILCYIDNHIFASGYLCKNCCNLYLAVLELQQPCDFCLILFCLLSNHGKYLVLIQSIVQSHSLGYQIQHLLSDICLILMVSQDMDDSTWKLLHVMHFRPHDALYFYTIMSV